MKFGFTLSHCIIFEKFYDNDYTFWIKKISALIVEGTGYHKLKKKNIVS